MATLVLTAVGTALGGPLGGALGGMLGQTIDTQLFGTGPRRGPRLDDLKLQTSSYGTPIPRIYGRMRVAGSVIWATDFKESEAIEGGGKGGPESVQYNYSCSFAVAVSSRPILGIGRIWADGKLIRGAGGDFKVQSGFRVVTGSEGQGPDPLIESIEGVGGTPAYRGLAVAVFEDMGLAEFGNRLPMLTLEVVADDGPVGVEAIVDDASGGAIGTEPDGTVPAVTGFAALGTDRRAALDQLAALAAVRLSEHQGSLAQNQRPASVLDDPAALGCSADGKTYPGPGEWDQEAATALPSGLSIRYHDPSRDFQAGVMRVTVPGGRGEMEFDSAAAMDASAAKALAMRNMSRRWAGRDRISLRLPPSFLDLVPGDTLELGWRGGRWLVEEVTVDSFVVIADLRRMAEAGAPAPADPGRGNAQPDVPIGKSVIALFDLPDLEDAGDSRPRLHVAVSAQGAFKPVAASSTVAEAPGPTITVTRRARLGTTVNALTDGPWGLIDGRSSVDVQLVDDSQLILNADADALDRGANLCMVGDELVQFGRAQDLGGGRFRLSRLLRGRRGTEWASAGHVKDEPFAMMDRASLVALPLDNASVGQSVQVEAHGIQDDILAPSVASRVIVDVANLPLSPVRLQTVSRSPLVMQWTRRSRHQWAWLDGEVAEPDATFQVRLTGSFGSVERQVFEPCITLLDSERAQLGPGSVSVSIVELGPNRRSMPLAGTFTN